MGTAAKPEPAAPAAPPASAPASSAAPASTPPTPSPSPAPAPSTDAELARLRKIVETQDAVIRDSANQQRNMVSELQKLRGAMTPPPAPTDPKQFFNNPQEEVGKIVASEVEKTVAPLREMMQKLVAGTSRNDALAEYKKQHANFDWNKLEPVVNAMVEQANSRGVTVDKGTMDIIVLSALGMAATGQIEGAMTTPAAAPAPAAPAPGVPVPVITPPHLMPSAPPIPAPQPNGAKPTRALTENEARLARERGWSPEQYLSWLDVDPTQVVTHKAPGDK